MTAIAVEDLVAGYGDMPVVRDVSLSVGQGEIVALLGPNGAGKTTTLLTIAGVLPLLGGGVDVLGAPLGRQPVERIARRGLALLPEDQAVFHQLTVAENLRVHAGRRPSISRQEVLEYFPALSPLMSRKAGLLSGGEQRMLAFACKLIADPRVLMIDELSLGLAPTIVAGLLDVLSRLARERDLAVLLVEQHVQAAVGIADRVYVLNHGELVASGEVADITADPERLEASYFGVPAAPAPRDPETHRPSSQGVHR
jgi:branched-chain amino acid transport system ATP-binding protein